MLIFTHSCNTLIADGIHWKWFFQDKTGDYIHVLKITNTENQATTRK